jgi:hypothetical protein
MPPKPPINKSKRPAPSDKTSDGARGGGGGAGKPVSLSGMNLYFTAASFASPLSPSLPSLLASVYSADLFARYAVARPPREEPDLPQSPPHLPLPPSQRLPPPPRARRPDPQVQADDPRVAGEAAVDKGREAGDLQEGQEPGVGVGA